MQQAHPLMQLLRITTWTLIYNMTEKMTSMSLGNKMKEKVKRIQELRRSNAATPIKNKKFYTRKEKYKNK